MSSVFSPRYTITERLLTNIKQINILVENLNHRNFPKVVQFEFEKTAREVSSFASTSIEGNPLPLTEVKKILKSTPHHLRDSEREVINYNQVLADLNDKIKKEGVSLSIPLILTIQKGVTSGLLPKQESGHFRKSPVVVNDPRTGKIVFIPPDETDIKALMGDLLNYISKKRKATDHLILAGIFHKQMVLIHPFSDGNGRTARLATKVLLAEMGLNTFNLFSFENYYNRNVSRYFQMVGEQGDYYELERKVNFTPWLEYFTEGIIDELLRVQKILLPAAAAQNQLTSYQQKILDFVKVHGSIRDRDYAKLVKRAKPTRALDFRKLVKLGILTRKRKGPATYYIQKER
ncbi:MAG: Fic family protein [candidate division CPR1 bacterium GW2011_GWC1_49_13]|uniref:Fic family protein n=1 Tax=candidate division CPR1 bacterium GW2011_GWC1_49_13 TaxID=1618342 RepID=A0A0G1VJ54_9BACT|nr:MAG: Fic family protein [candidate division CPR1 bacterium GW2011_GWC1_49_13]